MRSIASSTLPPADVQHLCELAYLIRAWWETFNDSLRQVDPVAARKGHDAVIDAAITARRIARDQGFDLPDCSGIDWSAAPVPAGHTEGANDL